MRYVFHTHERVRAWRLVTAEGAPLPDGFRSEDWLHSRTREADDTGTDVRREVDERGYVLFKLGGDFADVARDVRAQAAAARVGDSLRPATELRAAKQLERYPVHLGLGATAWSEPEFAGAEWYAAYEARHVADGSEGRLVSTFTFDSPWDSWEMHPSGSEVVLCTAGAITLIQEIDGAHLRTKLEPGRYAINAPGVWHTADVERAATAVFITAGAGTQHRPR
jgi:hypothetical protein